MRRIVGDASDNPSTSGATPGSERSGSDDRRVEEGRRVGEDHPVGEDRRADHGGPRHEGGSSTHPVLDPTATHWLLPIDPAAHRDHLPADWRTRPDATEVWQAIARTQPIDRWCLRTGYRTMRVGDVIWAYLSRRQEVCAVGLVHGIEAAEDEGDRHVLVDWDAAATTALTRNPLPRNAFGQVPMSTCRARPEVTTHLVSHLRHLGMS